MNLYLISQPGDNGHFYDAYEFAVVAAESEHRAKLIHPMGVSDDHWKSYQPATPYEWNPETKQWECSITYEGKSKKMAAGAGAWAKSPDDVEVELIGVAKDGTVEGVICSSFHLEG
jgi:hypothetical protein